MSLLGLICGAGCVERILTVRSDPPGALVYMNDQEVGRTPFTHRFIWYGTYDVQVRRDGYEPLKVESPVIAPWWQWVPLDLAAELVPVHLEDHHDLSYTLKPLKMQAIDPDAITERGEPLRERLESSHVPRPATTHPATRPAR